MGSDLAQWLGSALAGSCRRCDRREGGWRGRRLDGQVDRLRAERITALGSELDESRRGQSHRHDGRALLVGGRLRRR